MRRKKWLVACLLLASHGLCASELAAASEDLCSDLFVAQASASQEHGQGSRPRSGIVSIGRFGSLGGAFAWNSALEIYNSVLSTEGLLKFPFVPLPAKKLELNRDAHVRSIGTALRPMVDETKEQLARFWAWSKKTRALQNADDFFNKHRAQIRTWRTRQSGHRLKNGILSGATLLAEQAGSTLRFVLKTYPRVLAVVFSINVIGQFTYAENAQIHAVQPSSHVAAMSPLRDDQAQILVRNLPFPHVALRIGNQVFSHNQTHLIVSSVDSYLGLQALARAGAGRLAEAELNPLGIQARSTSSVVLNLSSETVSEIRDDLMAHVNQAYFNKTYINDCATMVARVLRENGIWVPLHVLDASPSILLSYFALEYNAERVLNDPTPMVDRFEDFEIIGANETVDMGEARRRSFFVHFVESSLMLNAYSFAFNLEQRIGYDRIFTERSAFYGADTNYLELVRRLSDRAFLELLNEPAYRLYQAELSVSENGSGTRAIRKKHEAALTELRTGYQTEIRSLEIDDFTYHTLLAKIKILSDDLIMAD